MPRTVREVLEELTRKRPLPNCCSKCNECYDQALRDLQDVIVPEEKNEQPGCQSLNSQIDNKKYREGFNQCRTEVLTRMERVDKI